MNDIIFFFFYNFSHQSDFLDQIFIFLAVYFPYLVIIFAGVFLLMHHEVFKAENIWKILIQKKKEILNSFFVGVLAWILARLLKFIIQIPRPFESLSDVNPLFLESGYAFPSGHATFFMALAISIFLFHQKAGYFFIFFALIIGLARIVVGVHFPVDIIGGFILGSLVAYLIRRFSF